MSNSLTTPLPKIHRAVRAEEFLKYLEDDLVITEEQADQYLDYIDDELCRREDDHSSGLTAGDLSVHNETCQGLDVVAQHMEGLQIDFLF